MSAKETIRELIREEIESQKRLDVNFYPVRNRYLENRLQIIYRFLIAIAMIAIIILLIAAFDYFNVGEFRSWISGETESVSKSITNIASNAGGESQKLMSFFAGHSIKKDGSELLHSFESHVEAFTDKSSIDSLSTASGHYGLDVSHWQKTIDWGKVQNDTTAGGFDFYIIKATQGASGQDPNFAINWRAARQSTAILGAYHYFIFDDDPKNQAQNFISSVTLKSGDFPPIVDVERNCSNCTALDNNTQSVITNLRILLKTLEQHYGVKPMIYTDNDLFERYFKEAFSSYPFWIAKYSKTPPAAFDPEGDSQGTGGPDISIWQFTDDGHVSGIVGDVNLNFMPEASMSSALFVQ
jgi:lysozyme